MRRWAALLGFLLVGLSATSARADGLTATPEANDPAMRSFVPERRNGAILGVSGGLALAGASGYPNDIKLIGNPDFYSESPLLAGWATSAFLMGALNDYVSFGPLFNIATFDTPKWKSTGFALGFRADFFPFVKLLPKLADTAVYGQLGFGSTKLQAKGPYPSADGSQSFLGIGVHHEFRLGRFLGGHGAAGPMVEYNAIRSDSAERHWLTMGLRVVWYGGRVQLDGPR